MFNFENIKEDKRHIRKIQLGAGGSTDPNYINTDFYQSQTADMILDITKEMPFDDSTIEEFWSNHVLEHLTLDQIDILFKEIYRCLKPGHKFISVLPDFEKAALQFIKGENLYNATGSIWGCATLGWQPKEAHIHMYGWTKRSLENRLKQHGFKVIECKQSGNDITELNFIAIKEK